MEWIDCKGLSSKELEEIRYQHERTSGNRAVFLYGDGSTQDGYVLYSAGAPVKYLLASVHPNASMISKYVSSMRPVYLDGVETEDPMAAMDTLSSERLSFLPPKKTAMIKYRQYLWLADGILSRRIVNHRVFADITGIESNKKFVRWIDDDWVTEEVEI